MNRFNAYFANHFGGCRQLADAYDHCRNRAVKLYQIPGIADCIGVTDTVDCWIAPVSESLFTVNITRLLKDLQEGKKIQLPVRGHQLTQTRRRALLINPEAPIPRPRIKLIS